MEIAGSGGSVVRPLDYSSTKVQGHGFYPAFNPFSFFRFLILFPKFFFFAVSIVVGNTHQIDGNSLGLFFDSQSAKQITFG